MLQNTSEFQSINPGGFGGGFGGNQGFGLFGLLGLLGIGDLNGRRDRGGDDGGCRNELATLAAISSAKDTTVAEARALSNAVCESEKTNLQQFYSQAIQASNNTNELKAQAVAFAVANDSKLDAISRQIANDGDLTRALINTNTINDLRDQLLLERRGRDRDGIEISIQNSNAQAQSQLQTQSQWLAGNFDRFNDRLDHITQLNKSTQDVINFGTMAASANQANQQTNVK